MSSTLGLLLCYRDSFPADISCSLLEQGKLYKTLGKIRAFVFRYKVKNKNGEQTERSLQLVLSQVNWRNWWKNFYNMFIANYTFLTPTRGLLKLLQYTCLLYSLVRICFCFEIGSHNSYFSFQKNQNKTKNKRKKICKIFLLYSEH